MDPGKAELRHGHLLDTVTEAVTEMVRLVR